MQQAEREMTLAALLDITVDQWVTPLRSGTITDDDFPEGTQELFGTLIGSLMSSPDEAQLYIQQIALMSDDTLAWAVKTFGVDPIVL